VRRIVIPIAVLLAVALSSPPIATAKVSGFRFGVTAGEVAAHSAHIWGAAEGSGRVTAKVATDRRFRHVVARKRIKAKGSNDRTVQVRVKGLKAGRRHFYRFCAKGASCGPKGKFTTAPKPRRTETIRFGFTGDTDGTPLPGADTPFFGPFEVFRAMRAEGNDFNVHKGDTIYSDSGVAGGPPARTVPEKWGKYRQNLEVRNLTRLRKASGFYSHWDDHEFINDFSIPEDGETLYEAGVTAFRDYAPVTYSRANGLYRSFRWGKNLEIFFLDERSFRSAKASAGGTCDNPATNSPDLAPTAPDSSRQLFSVLIPSLNQPVSGACKNTINDPNRTFLGERQFIRFVRDVDESKARWKVIMNETPIQQFYGLPYDRWEGYAYERVELLRQLDERGVSDLVFLSTDTHAAFANVVRFRTLAGDVAPSNAPPAPADTEYQDFIAGPVATSPFWDEIDDVTGAPGGGELLSQVFFGREPPDGVGMQCAQGGLYNYAQVTVRKRALEVAYRDKDGNIVQDWDGDACGPYTLNR
jgi:phosphodiesterase/alkaline phosphatase D-like protein